MIFSGTLIYLFLAIPTICGCKNRSQTKKYDEKALQILTNKKENI
jgi:hypothetical protein